MNLTIPSMNVSAGGSGIHRKVNKTSNEKHTGAEYKSKKAKGSILFSLK